MGDERTVTLTIKLNDDDVKKGTVSLDRLKAAAQDVGKVETQSASFARLNKDVTEGMNGVTEIRKQVGELHKVMASSPDQATFAAKYKKELIDLLTTVRSSSTSVEDYAKRLKLIPASMQDAIKIANELTNSTKKVGGGSQEAHTSIRQLVSGIAQIESAAGPAGRHLGNLERGFATLSGSGLGAAGVIVGIVAGLGLLVYGAIKAAEAVYSLAKGFADYNNELEKTSRTTGLSGTMIEALRLEADKANVSFNDIAGAVGKFGENIGKAAGGSVEAQRALAAVGVTAKTAMTDVDGAFTRAVAAIAKMPPGLARSRVEFNLFGSDWTKLDDVIRESGGNMDAAVKRARELGLGMSKDAAAGTREFNRALAEAKVAIQGVENALGKEFLPSASKGLRDFTGWITQNKAEIKDWAQRAGEAVKNILSALMDLIRFLRDHRQELSGTAALLRGDYAGAAGAFAAPDVPTVPTSGQTSQSSGGMSWQDIFERARKDQEANAAILEAQRAAAEETAKKDLAANIKIAADDAAEQKTMVQNLFKDAESAFSGANDAGIKSTPEAFQESVAKSLAHYEAWYKYRLDLLDKFENQQAAIENKTAKELDALHADQEKRRQGYADTAVEIQRQMQAKLAADRKQANAEQFAEAESKSRREIEQMKSRAQAELARVTADHTSGIGATGTYTQEEQKFLNYKQIIARGEIASQIDNLTQLMGQPNADPKKKTDLQGQIDVLKQQLANLVETQGRELTPDAQAMKDATDELNRIHRQDRDEQYVADRRHLEAKQQEIGLQKEIDSLRDELANGGVNDALKIEVAHLRDVLEYRNRELNAVIELQHAQFELSHATDVSNTQIKAGIYEHLAAQKTLQQATIDGYNEEFDAITRIVNGPLDKLNAKSKGLLSIFTEPLKAIENQAIGGFFHSFVEKMFPDLPSGNAVLDENKKHTTLLQQIVNNTGGGGINPTFGGGRGIGSVLSRINPNWTSGPGWGGGGYSTPPFNGNAGTGGGGSPPNDPSLGGLIDPDTGGWTNASTPRYSGLRSIFNPQKNPITGNMNGKLAGQLGGIGSIATMAGSAIGGKFGTVLQDAGMGMQIGSMFGPWGAAIGAATGAIFGLLHHDDANKKLKEAAQAQYGINVKDGSVLNALKSLGEGMFGRGNVGKNAAAIVGSEQGRNILSAYAKSSGQSSLQIDRLNYGDPNWAGNDFRMDSGPGSGGSFASYDQGRVGSSMPSIGGSSMPAPQFAAAGNVMHPQIIAGLAESIYKLQETVAQFQTMPAGQVVAHGLAGNEDNIADAYHTSSQQNAYTSENAARARGDYQ